MATSRTYRHRVEFYRPTQTTEASGQVVREYELAFARRASVEQTGENIVEINGQKQLQSDYKICLPYDPGLLEICAATWQVVWLETGERLNVSRRFAERNQRRPVMIIEGTLDR